jgi:lysozyme
MMAPDQIRALQRAMLTVPGVTLPRFGADGEWGAETAAAFALVIAKAGGTPVGWSATPTWEDERLLDDLRRFEGLRLSPYLDTEGVPTIGYGHTGPEITMAHPGITAARAEELLRLDVAKHDRLLFAALPWVERLDPARRMVMRNLAFNMGVGWPPTRDRKGRGLRSFVNTLAAIQAGQWDKAADGLLASKWAKQVGPTRSGYLASIMRSGRLT